MAGNQVMHLNHVLCFLFSKVHKHDEKFIKGAILDYFSPADIHAAQELFLNIVSTFNDLDSLSKIRKRRGEGRVENEICDIFNIIHELDEKQLFSHLPVFVSDSVEEMPSRNILEGDLKAVMLRFAKLESQLSQVQICVNNLSAAMLSAANMPSTVSTCMPSQHALAKGQPNLLTAGNSGGAAVLSSQPTFINENCLPPRRDWANEFTTGSSCDEQSSSNQGADGGWQEKSTRKRRRMRSSQHTAIGSLPKHFQQTKDAVVSDSFRVDPSNANSQASALPQNNVPALGLNINQNMPQTFASVAAKPVDPQAQQMARQQFSLKQNLKQKRGPIIIGRSRSNNSSDKQSLVAAAKPYISKATFCIDNVSTDVTELSLSKFIAAMDIDVLGCYRVNPRRTHYQRIHKIFPDDRATFRVCIPREDSDRFLDPKKWPAHISVSWWAFKKKGSEPGNIINTDNSRQVSDQESVSQHQQTPQDINALSIHTAVVDPADCNTIGVINTMSTPLKVGDLTLIDTLEDMEATIIISNNGDV